MVDLPEASVSIDPEAGASALGLDYLVLLAPVASNADRTPRVFASTKALLTKHAYSRGASYAASHFEETRKPIIFLGMPIAVPGAVIWQDDSGVTGTSELEVTAGGSGCLEECDGELEITAGGVVGTAQIQGLLSLDGGRTQVPLRLGTGTSYTHPYYGFVLSAGAGTLVVGDVFRFTTSAPRGVRTDYALARTALAAQLKSARSWLFVDEALVEDDATAMVTQLNAYETADQRFVYARANVRDRYAAPKLTRKRHRTVGASLTFAEVGASADTVTRAAGSFIDDGFAVGDTVAITGAVTGGGANNVTGVITALSATVMTFGSSPDLTPEGPISTAVITGYSTLTFAASTDTITRNVGSFLTEGFKVGDAVTIDGTSSNDGEFVITALTATVMTFAAGLADETISTKLASLTAPEETDSDNVAANDAEFEDIGDEMRIDLAQGRGRKICPITQWNLRRASSWGLSIREFQHDVQVPPWRKSDGPLNGFDLEDEDGNVVEHDERISRDALPARFSCLRTWANGPRGTFVAHSITRSAGKFLSRTHNVAVANIACSVTQAQTEEAGIGAILESNPDNTLAETDLQGIETKVNSALNTELRTRRFEGVRASAVSWTASRSDVFDAPDTELTGTVNLRLNRTIEKLRTRVRVQ